MKKNFIGFYRACDLLTMTGTCFAMFGIILSINGNRFLPIVCLIISGICDAFDGKLARMSKSTKEQKVYGVQLDSLSDLISFGIFPLVYTICILPSDCYFGWVASIFYAICGMIRLAYFNMLDICNKSDSEYFVGMPITSIAIFYPVVYIVLKLINFKYYDVIIPCFLIFVGIFFISKFKVKKLNDSKKVILSVFGMVFILFIIFFGFILNFKI